MKKKYTIKTRYGKIESIKDRFMNKNLTYFCCHHIYNGVDVFNNFCDAVKYMNEKQLKINF